MNSLRALIHRAHLGLLLASVLVLFLFACADAPRPGTAPKHVLLLTAENVRGDHVTRLGYPRNTTGLLRLDQPFVLDLDYPAEDGVAFSRAIAPSSDDQISVASLLTGVLPVVEGEVVLGSDRSTLAEEFRAKGFQTGGFFNGSSFSAENASMSGFGRGFSHAEFGASDKEVLAAAVKWLESRKNPDSSLFTWIHLAGIDKPFQGKAQSDFLSVSEYSGPVRSEPGFFEDLEAGRVELREEDRSRLIDLYDGRLTRLTELFNSFFFIYKNEIGDGLLWTDTLVVFAGTSGCELAERDGRVATDDSLVDAGLHVPMFLSHKGSLTGERIFGSVVELVDLNTTLRDWFDLDSEGEPTGRSLLTLTDSYIKREFPVYPALSIRRRGNEVTGMTVRTKRWRMIVEGDRAQLFDLEVDPAARMDMAAVYPEEVTALRSQLDQRARAIGLQGGSP